MVISSRVELSASSSHAWYLILMVAFHGLCGVRNINCEWLANPQKKNKHTTKQQIYIEIGWWLTLRFSCYVVCVYRVSYPTYAKVQVMCFIFIKYTGTVPVLCYSVSIRAYTNILIANTYHQICVATHLSRCVRV